MPTLVPPNFCTKYFALGSILFWCKFGGVAGNTESTEEVVDVLSSDINGLLGAEIGLEDDPELLGPISRDMVSAVVSRGQRRT